MKENIEIQREMYLYFIDYEKAFDHEDLLDIEKGIGVDGKGLRIVCKLYWNHKAAVREKI